MLLARVARGRRRRWLNIRCATSAPEVSVQIAALSRDVGLHPRLAKHMLEGRPLRISTAIVYMFRRNAGNVSTNNSRCLWLDKDSGTRIVLFGFAALGRRQGVDNILRHIIPPIPCLHDGGSSYTVDVVNAVLFMYTTYIVIFGKERFGFLI